MFMARTWRKRSGSANVRATRRARTVRGSPGSRAASIGNPDNGRIHYVKGSWVFRSLERALGATTFDRGMRDYIAIRRQGRAAGYEEFSRPCRGPRGAT